MFNKKNKVMKALFVILISVVLLTSCNKTKTADDSKQVPQKTMEENFKTSNPDAKDVSWETEGEFKEVEYTQNGVTKSIVYDAEGKVIETETEINVDQLPATILAYINDNYPDTEIEEAEKLENSEGNFFEVEIETTNDEEIELMFSSEGSFINEVIETETEEDDDEGEENEVEIDPTELPAAILEYIGQNYSDYALTEAEKEITEEGIFYEVELTSPDGEELDLIFDQDGNFIEIEVEE